MKRLDTCDMWCQLRKIPNIRWSIHVKNIDTRKKTNQLQLTNITKKPCPQLFAHLQRMDASRWPSKQSRCTDGLPTMGKLEGRQATWTGLPYDMVESGRGISSCERPQDLEACSTSDTRCKVARCYLMIMIARCYLW